MNLPALPYKQLAASLALAAAMLLASQAGNDGLLAHGPRMLVDTTPTAKVVRGRV